MAGEGQDRALGKGREGEEDIVGIPLSPPNGTLGSAYGQERYWSLMLCPFNSRRMVSAKRAATVSCFTFPHDP